MNIAVIGDKNVGKSTFLVLLYAAQIRYSELSNGEFRFYINPKSLKIISEEYNRMQMGNWPSDKIIKNNQEISFLFSGSSDSKDKGFLKIFRRSKSTPKISINFTLYDFSDTELSNTINSDTISFFKISQKVESLLSSNVLAILIDSSKLQEKKLYQKVQKKDEKKAEDTTKKNDDFFNYNVLANISRFHRKMIYPIFVFSKFGQLNKNILQKLKLPKKPPGIKYPDKRRIYGERLMTKFYPTTLNLVKVNKRINYDSGQYYFTSILTTKNQKGGMAPALKKGREIKYILDCSYSEFIGFIEHVGKLSSKS